MTGLPAAGLIWARQAGSASRLRVVLRDVVASGESPPYDVFLVLEGSSPFEAGATSVRIGALDLFGGAGRSHHGHAGGGATIALEVSQAVEQLSRQRGFNLSRLRVSVVRRGFASTVGGEFVPPDPQPPQIGAVELIQS